jgi:hypothetical protein
LWDGVKNFFLIMGMAWMAGQNPAKTPGAAGAEPVPRPALSTPELRMYVD